MNWNAFPTYFGFFLEACGSAYDFVIIPARIEEDVRHCEGHDICMGRSRHPTPVPYEIDFRRTGTECVLVCKIGVSIARSLKSSTRSL
jgi:hypothetical protein